MRRTFWGFSKPYVRTQIAILASPGGPLRSVYCLHQVLRSSSPPFFSSIHCSVGLYLLLHRCTTRMNDHFAKKSLKFSRIPQTEDCETLLSESHEPEIYTKSRKCLTYRYGMGILLTICFLVTAFVGAWVGSRWIQNPGSFCTQYISQYCKYMHSANSK